MKSRNIFSSLLSATLVIACALTLTVPAAEQSAQAATNSQVVNVYTARHYEVDDVLYENFTKQTGIKVNVVKGSAPELVERMKREGSRSPADLFITVDGGVLTSAKQAGILQPIKSAIVDQNVPSHLKDKDNHWVALSTRARVIVYAKGRVTPEQLSTYEDLATSKWKGKVVVRSSTHMYNQSLVASLIAISGEEATANWAKGIAANLARQPQGGDRDQAKAIVAGIGDVAIMNTYYVGQLANSKDPEEVNVAQAIGVFFPNQKTTGTHINISGVGLAKYSPNKANAIKLIEYLTSEQAQTMFSQANYEYPVNPKAKLPALLKSWGEFKAQRIDFAKLGEYNKLAIQLMDKANWR